MGTNRAYFWRLIGVALVLRTCGIPLWRHRFDGHELDYLAAFQGEPWSASTRVYPLLAGLYQALGRVFSDPRLLVGINVLAGLVTVLAGGFWAKRRWGAGVGWMLAALLALSPTHVFWSSSIYNVALPQAFLVCGIALGGWRGMMCFAIACSLRMELALLFPVVWLLSDWRVGVGALSAGLCWPLLQTAPQVLAPTEALSVNLWLPDLLGPLGSPFGLLLVALALQRHNFTLALAALWVHFIGAAFDDYGTRHALLGGLCLIALLATTTGWRRVLPLLAGALFCTHLADLHTTYHMTPAQFAEGLPDLPHHNALPKDCTEVLDDPLSASSHWQFRKAWPPGRLCWGEERIHRAWTSRGLQDRRLRMHRTYDLTPAFVLDLPSGPRLYYDWRQ
jgi:hypothetical protein